MIQKIIFDKVSHSFTNKKIFENFSIELNAGKIITVTGANGSGKSTFLKLAGKFIEPNFGMINAFDDEVIDKIKFRNKIAAVTPNLNFYSDLTAIENINFFVGLRNIILNDVDELFERVGLEINTKNKLIKTFSTGMIQRLKFLIMIAVNSDVWILDEPCSNLDQIGKNIFLHEIKNSAQNGKLILMATNDKDEENIADEIIHLPNH